MTVSSCPTRRSRVPGWVGSGQIQLAVSIEVSGHNVYGIAAEKGSGGVAVYGSGNVYIADTENNRVLKETPSGGSYTESTIAASGPEQSRWWLVEGEYLLPV